MYSPGFRTLLAVASICALAGIAPGSDALAQPRDRAKDTRAIKEVFSGYRAALLEGDGVRTADLVSAQTIKFYEEIVALALSAPPRELSRLDFVAKLMVLRVRHEYDKADIEKMTGRELLITGVRRGWISKSSLSGLEHLAAIKVDGHKASAEMPSAPGIPVLHFLHESGEWKLHLLASFELANYAIGQEVAKSGLTEDQFIVRLLNALSPKKVDEEQIFSGPRE